MESTNATADPWQTLNDELDAWHANEKVADFWWRDDDAVAVGSQLEKLISITETTGLLLAVIPAHAKAELASAVNAVSHVKAAQHGYAHINHAERGKGLGAWELGLHRGEQVVLDELDHGRLLLETLFEDNFMPVIVPPWNRMDAALLEPVAVRGFTGVSWFGPRDTSMQSKNFSVINSHCDPIRWKTGAKFKGELKTISQLVEHLHARRIGTVDATEPTGYLTHHIDMSNDSWAFSEQLVQHINNHPAACWCRDIVELFGEST